MPADFVLENLVVRYGEKTALEGIDLQIPAHRVTVLIGPSGCGKSTTLRTLNGLVRPASGAVYFQGRNVAEAETTSLRRGMGYAIQSVGLIPHLTVAENVSLVPRLLDWAVDRRDARSRELLDLVKLDPDEYGPKYPSQLSGGEAQRVGVARALGADPPVLLMDEPFGAVDPLNREILQDEFIRIQRKLKKTVVFVTHDLEEAVRLADHLVIMKDGRIVQAADPAEILAQPADEFVEKFLGPDRALKRLTLFTADRIMAEPSGPVRWQTDEAGRPVAGSFGSGAKIVQRSVDAAVHGLAAYGSLKEALSRILALGLPAVPVVDEDGRLIGEVRYEDIQEISLQ